MDATDIRIIRTMGLQPYGRHPRPADGLKPGSIARALKISPEAVRERLAKLEASGVLEGFEIFPNLRHFGLESTCYYLRLQDHAQAEAVAQRIRHLEGILGIYTFTEPELCINLGYRSPAELERKLKLLLAVAGEAELQKFYDIEMPTLARPLSTLDWRILKALRGKALRPLTEVARELGVSTKTVKRRFDQMSREGSFFIIPVLDPAKIPGLILFELIVWLGPEAAPGTFQAVSRALDAYMVCVDYPASHEVGSYGFGLYAVRLGDIEAARRRALAVKGVERVRPLVLQGSDERFEWIEDEMDARIRGSVPGSSG